MDNANEKGVLTLDSLQYPRLLRSIHKPPNPLYYSGDISICGNLCIAVVGSRKATPYGRWVAYNIAKRAAEHNITVVSGMAYGIDSESHKGALDAGGKTIAVLGCGIDICYPVSNKQLMRRIESKGLILSEYPPGTSPKPYMFPNRNRIISGLSTIVVIVEAGLNSGSLITADCALSQGREVMAVPGNINSIYSIGTNKLIQDGATPVVVIDDVLTALGIDVNQDWTEESLGNDEALIFRLICENGESSVKKLCQLTGKAASDVGALVTVLEMKGKVYTSLGKIYIAKS